MSIKQVIKFLFLFNLLIIQSFTKSIDNERQRQLDNERYESNDEQIPQIEEQITEEQTTEEQITEEQTTEEQITEQITEEQIPQKPQKIRKSITVDDCGHNHLESIDDKIVGGQVAKIGQFPWQVVLAIKHTSRNELQLCGGSIINKNWILTAGHCVTDERNGNYSVLRLRVTAGLHNRRFTESFRAQNRFVDCIIKHKDWKGFLGGFANDIALLRIPFDIPLDITHKRGGIVNGICMPPNTSPPLDTLSGTARISGWGLTGMNEGTSELLKFTDVSIVNDLTCNTNDLPFPIIESMICQGVDNTSPCFGDSGGPLIIKMNGSYTQIGLVSTGPLPCANSKYPNAVYTQISYFIDWIEKTIEENDKSDICTGKLLQKPTKILEY